MSNIAPLKRPIDEVNFSLDTDFSKNKLLRKDGMHNREISTILVKNLPRSYNQGKIKKIFKDCGAVIRIETVESLDKLSRLARLEFETYENALMALTKTNKTYGDKEIEVTLLENLTLWITNFPPSYTGQDLKNLFLRNNILTISIRFPSLRFNNNRRFAYVDVTTLDDVKKVVELYNGTVISNYQLVVKKSNPVEKQKRTDSAVLERREIFIKNIDSSNIDEEMLRNAFEKYGEIESMKLLTKKNASDTTGFAFIIFKRSEDAMKALELHRTTLNDNLIYVSLSDKKAYLERQEMKRIINSKHRMNDNMLASIYPISDKLTKAQIENLILEKAHIPADSIKKIFLVTDYEGCIIVFNNSSATAKCMLALNNTEFNKKTIMCDTVDKLKKHNNQCSEKGTDRYHELQPNIKNTLKEEVEVPKLNDNAVDDHKNGKLNNDDFRKMFGL